MPNVRSAIMSHSTTAAASSTQGSLHPSFDTVYAETRVREAAKCIGWEDAGRLDALLTCMRDELVLYAWQLPAIDSAQWKSLGAPIGLAAAIRQLATMRRDHSSISPSKFADSPSTKSVDNSLLEVVEYSTGVEVFEDQEEDETTGSPLTSLLGLSSPSSKPPVSFASQESTEQAAVNDTTSKQRAGSNVALQLFPTTSIDKENAGDVASSGESNNTRSLQTRHSAFDNRRSVSAPRPRAPRSSSLPMSLRHESKGRALANAIPYTTGSEADAHRFQTEWEEVQAVLCRLPISDQRAILGQLIIVANGQTQTARIKLAEGVIVRLRHHFPQEEVKVQLDLIVDHLRSFARFRSDQRRLFGKVLFLSLSQLHAAKSSEAIDSTTTTTNQPASSTASCSDTVVIPPPPSVSA